MAKLKETSTRRGAIRCLITSVVLVVVLGFAAGTLGASDVPVTHTPHGGHPIEALLGAIIPYIAGAIEMVGVAIIVYGSVAALFLFVRSHLDFNSTEVKLELAQALALSLEFKLAAEILKSVVVRTLQELILLAAIVALRVVMTLLIHWEIETSAADGDPHTYRASTSDDTLSARIRERRSDPDKKSHERGFVYRHRPSNHNDDAQDTSDNHSNVRQFRATQYKSFNERTPTPFNLHHRQVTREHDGLTITIQRQIGRLMGKRRPE